MAPERRTKRFSPRFRPVGRFCEVRFRYLSSPTGREGGREGGREREREGERERDKSAPRPYETDPFIHSARLTDSANFYIYIYIYKTVFLIFCPCGTLRCVLMWSKFNNCARPLARTLISRLRPLVELLLFFIRGVVVTTSAKYMAFALAHCLKHEIAHFVSFHFIHVSLCLFLCLFSGFEANIFVLVL